MIPPSRAVALANVELGARPCDNKTPRQHGRSPPVSFRLVEIPSSESGQLPGNPVSVDRPASRGAATISAFQRLKRFPLTSDFRPPWLAVANQRRRLTSGFTLIELTVVIL